MRPNGSFSNMDGPVERPQLRRNRKFLSNTSHPRPSTYTRPTPVWVVAAATCAGGMIPLPLERHCLAGLGAVTASTASPCGGVTVVTAATDLWHLQPAGGRSIHGRQFLGDDRIQSS